LEAEWFVGQPTGQGLQLLLVAAVDVVPDRLGPLLGFGIKVAETLVGQEFFLPVGGL
jgi:hypothetical protein